MDDRTMIARDILGLILNQRSTRYEPELFAQKAVAYTDALLSALATSGGKDDPNPETAAKGPRWRKMDDPPKHTGAVIVVSTDSPHTHFGATYRGGRWKWYDCGDSSAPLHVAPSDRWLDLMGFLPMEND